MVFVIDFCDESGLVHTFTFHGEKACMFEDEHPLLSLVLHGDVEDGEGMCHSSDRWRLSQNVVKFSR